MHRKAGNCFRHWSHFMSPLRYSCTVPTRTMPHAAGPRTGAWCRWCRPSRSAASQGRTTGRCIATAIASSACFAGPKPGVACIPASTNSTLCSPLLSALLSSQKHCDSVHRTWFVQANGCNFRQSQPFACYGHSSSWTISQNA